MKKSLMFISLLITLTGCSQTNHNDTKEVASLENAIYFAPPIDSTWTEKLVLNNDELKEKLTNQQFYITRQAGTERAFTHPYNKNKKEGVYHCVVCGNPLFSSETKYNSGTGWPSFFAPYSGKSVAINTDYSHGMVREEVVCNRCDSHLGHVFNDGPQPTGLRYCMNGESLHFVEDGSEQNGRGKLKTAVFAQGCFWCVEEIFEAVKGVKEVVSGYAGGDSDNPDYKKVGSGKTNHAEAVEITYNPNKVSFKDLLKVYFYAGDVTQVNGQGPDHGPQYRSILFYETEEELKQIEEAIKNAEESGEFGLPLAIEVQKFKKFYVAEEYHQDFVKLNPNQGYVRNVSIPRYKKAVKNFPELLKKGARD